MKTIDFIHSLKRNYNNMAKISLYYPLTPWNITQPFGVNGAYYRANGINITGHNGQDAQAYHGQPIYASHDGTAYYEVDNSQGHGVVIVSDKPYDFNGKDTYFKTIYWHMCDPLHEPRYASPFYRGKNNSGEGIVVKAGDIIGFADSTGLSTGDHLHYGLKPIRVGKAVLSGDAPDVGIGDWVNVLPNNGTSGAIDPTPYFNGFYAEKAKERVVVLTTQVGLLTKVVELLKRLLSTGG